MLPLCESYRIRCVAVDRRGFGKSEWGRTPGSSTTEFNYDTFAKDTIQILEELDLQKIVFVAASMGCGETLLAYFGSDWVKHRCKVGNASARVWVWQAEVWFLMTLFLINRDSSGSVLPFPSHSRRQRIPGRPAESFGTRSSSAYEQIAQHLSTRRFLVSSVHKMEALALCWNLPYSTAMKES
jgi:hypothetical protein